MSLADVTGLLVGAVALGFVHGVEPGHGWPVAAAYALDRTNRWVSGFAASLILGIGHLVSSIAMVAVFFYAKSYFNLTQVNRPITLNEGIQLGGPVSLVAGIVLIVLGIREYRNGHAHDHGEHSHDDHSNERRSGHSHDEHGHDHASHDGVLARLKAFIPFVGGDSHDHGELDEAANRSLRSIAWFAFVLGFAHEEEFEIIALCAGSDYCLELMLVYALAVVVGIVGLTLLMIAGYEHSTERVERLTPYLPAFSAAVLVVMGLGFIAGVF